MALRDLLVYVDQTDGAFVRLRLAADLATRHASRLTALYVREWSIAQLEQRSTAELGLASAKDLDRMDRAVEGSIGVKANRLRSALEALGRSHGLQTEWRCVDGSASAVVPQHARCADLCISGGEAVPFGGYVEYTLSLHLLFAAGRPVLFIPGSESSRTLGRHIVVAWNSSRPGARAVSDALPLIERAERTTLLTVNPADFIDRHGALPAEWMLEHLRRHSNSVDMIQLEDVPTASISEALQAQVRSLGADLLVAGAFGHARLRETLLGGVTRDLLAAMRCPILMSH